MNPKDPPHSLEAEMMVLGAIIIDAKCIPDVERILRDPSAFYSDIHGRIYGTMLRLYDRKAGALDITMLWNALKDKAIEEAVGGSEYLNQLAGGVANSSNVRYHALEVWNKYRARRFIETCAMGMHRANNSSELDGQSITEIIDQTEASIFEIAHEQQSASAASLSELLMEEHLRLGTEFTDADRPVATGFIDLDTKLGGGLQKGELIVIGARPSMGKTAIATSIIEQVMLGTCAPAHCAISNRTPVSVGFISLEMRRDKIGQRFLSAMSGVDHERIRTRKLVKEPENEYDKTCDAATKLGRAKVLIDDASDSSVMSIRARARRMTQRHGIGLLVVDYLQLVTAPGSSRESRQVEVSAISRGLKLLAQELNIPILALCQLNRDVEGRASFRPRLADIRESGAIEQDADVVMFLHREAYYHKGEPAWTPGVEGADTDKTARLNHAELIIAKQRNGPIGTSHLYWDAATVRFKSWEGEPPKED